MERIQNLKEVYKIIIIYFITTVVSMISVKFIVKYEFVQENLKNYIWILLIFTLIFLILVKLFKVRFKSVVIFFSIIMFLLIFVMINLDRFFSPWSTPSKEIFPFISYIALYTTIPFQIVINVLLGFRIEHLSYIIVPIYILLMVLLSYFTLKDK